MEAVAKGPADGYTLVFGTPAVAINGALYKKLGYDPLKDLVPVSLAAWGPYIVYASGALPVGNIAELLAYAKARPGQLNYASVGVGSGTHLTAVLFTLAAGVNMSHVPYKGIQQAAPELVSGDVHLTFNAYGPLAQFVQSGKIKMLATTAPQRIKALPDLPTVAESLPGFKLPGRHGLLRARRHPAARAREAERGDRESGELARPERAHRESLPGAALQSLDEAARFVAAEAVKWTRAVKASGASAD